MNASEIMERFASKYAQCTTYRDRGIARSGSEVVSFETYFERPERFLFKWIANSEVNPSQNMIFSDGIDVVEVHRGKDSKHQNLQLAVASATGITLGALRLISTMLLPELSSCGRKVFENTFEILGKGTIEGESCWHLQSVYQTGCSEEFWISEHMLNMIKSKSTFTPNQEQHRLALSMITSNISSSFLSAEGLSGLPKDPEELVDERIYTEVHLDEELPENVFSGVL